MPGSWGRLQSRLRSDARAYAFDYRCEPQRLLDRSAKSTRLELRAERTVHAEVMVPQATGPGATVRRAVPGSDDAAASRLDNWEARGGGSSRCPT